MHSAFNALLLLRITHRPKTNEGDSEMSLPVSSSFRQNYVLAQILTVTV